MVYPHGQRGLSQCGHFSDKGEGVGFSRFSADVFYGRLLTVNKTYCYFKIFVLHFKRLFLAFKIFSTSYIEQLKNLFWDLSYRKIPKYGQINYLPNISLHFEFRLSLFSGSKVSFWEVPPVKGPPYLPYLFGLFVS